MKRSVSPLLCLTSQKSESLRERHFSSRLSLSHCTGTSNARLGSPSNSFPQQAHVHIFWTRFDTGDQAALARASASALRSAGLSSTDSPQPQAELWFGLLKVKPVRSVVTSKSISVPSR